MKERPGKFRLRKVVHGCVLTIVLLIAACTPSDMPEAATATPTRSTPPSRETAQTSPPATPPSTDGTADIESQILDMADGTPPVQIRLPALNEEIDVETMGWRITLLDGERTTVWNLPEAAAGWHSNSALPGTGGNVIISGHQLLGEAVFAAIALGEIETGMELHVIDTRGRTFAYRVIEVSEPVPISSDLGQEKALAATSLAGDGGPQMTLVAGWPDFSTTHRIFVRAEYMGILTP